MAAPRHHHLDDLRRLATSLAESLGVAPSRASSLATHLLWFDAAGFPTHGIGRLPGILEAIEARTVDPKAEGSVSLERNGTAVFDARHGIPLLALARAGEIATEKARDAGVGLVSVRNLGDPGPAAGVAAEIAIGPMAAGVLGPGGSWAVALPSPEGLPVVFDPALAIEPPGKTRKTLDALIAPWVSVFAPDEGFLVLAVAVMAIEPLLSFQARVAAAIEPLDKGSGRLLPARWEAIRREARSRGVAILPEAWTHLKRWADRLGLEIPNPTEG